MQVLCQRYRRFLGLRRFLYNTLSGSRSIATLVSWRLQHCKLNLSKAPAKHEVQTTLEEILDQPSGPTPCRLNAAAALAEMTSAFNEGTRILRTVTDEA